MLIFLPAKLEAKESAVDKALTPVGWAIGAAITPVYLGGEYATKSFEWTMDYAVGPALCGYLMMFEAMEDGASWAAEKAVDGIITGSQYTITPIIRGAAIGTDKVFEYTLYPLAKTAFYGALYSFQYGIIPAADGFDWTVSKAINGFVYGTKHSIIPFAKAYKLPMF